MGTKFEENVGLRFLAPRFQKTPSHIGTRKHGNPQSYFKYRPSMKISSASRLSWRPAKDRSPWWGWLDRKGYSRPINYVPRTIPVPTCQDISDVVSPGIACTSRGYGEVVVGASQAEGDLGEGGREVDENHRPPRQEGRRCTATGSRPPGRLRPHAAFTALRVAGLWCGRIP